MLAQITKTALLLVLSFTSVRLYGSVVDWSSPDGISRLETSQYKNDFFKLASQFESQHNKVYCGIATTTIVLNALRMYRNRSDIPLDHSLIDKRDLDYFPKNNFSPFYARYTQNTVVEKSQKPRISIFGKPMEITGEVEYGIKLGELEKLLLAHNLTTQTVHVGSLNYASKMKQEFIETLNTTDRYIVINYERAVFGQTPGGHISPIGAYHKASDSFLIMDVTPTKYNWVWVSSELLFKAMATIDGDSFRGYILVSD